MTNVHVLYFLVLLMLPISYWSERHNEEIARSLDLTLKQYNKWKKRLNTLLYVIFYLYAIYCDFGIFMRENPWYIIIWLFAVCFFCCVHNKHLIDKITQLEAEKLQYINNTTSSTQNVELSKEP